MSVRNHLEQVRLLNAGPSLRERLVHRIAADRQSPVVSRLRQFREKLERDMQPDPWTELRGPMVLLMADVCDALGLSECERAAVLGVVGENALQKLLASRPVFPPRNPLNVRQTKALTHVRDHGRISLSEYRELCPGLCNETLRRDLAVLAERGLLAKHGARRGTYYTSGA